MTKKQMMRKVAYLEFVNDQLLSELRYVDKLLQVVGFPQGLETVKSAAHEVLAFDEDWEGEEEGVEEAVEEEADEEY
jgi:hypothetical protein